MQAIRNCKARGMASLQIAQEPHGCSGLRRDRRQCPFQAVLCYSLEARRLNVSEQVNSPQTVALEPEGSSGVKFSMLSSLCGMAPSFHRNERLRLDRPPDLLFSSLTIIGPISIHYAAPIVSDSLLHLSVHNARGCNWIWPPRQ